MVGIFTILVFNVFLYARLLRMIQLPIPYYATEGMVLLLAVFVFVDFVRRPRWRREFFLVIFLLALSIVGMLGNAGNGISDSIFAIAKDEYVCWRFVIILLFGICAGELSEKYYDKVKSLLIWSARLAALIYLATGALIYMKHMSWNPLSGCMGEIVMILSVLLLSERWYDVFFMFAACGAAMSVAVGTMGNTTALAVVGVFGIIFLYKWVLRIRFNVPLLILSIAGAVGMGFYEFRDYYLNYATPSARMILLQDAMKLAKQYKPIGSGFATFCSQAAGDVPSSLYQLFEYNEVMVGCTLDNFWACIVGQYGYIGVGILSLIFLWLFVLCLRQGKNNRIFASMFYCLSYFLFSSLGGNSIFTAGSVAFLAFGFSYACNKSNEYDMIKEKGFL